MDDAEDRGIRADAEGERDDRDGRERGGFREVAECEANVLRPSDDPIDGGLPAYLSLGAACGVVPVRARIAEPA